MEEKKFSKFFVASLKRTAQNVYPLVRQRNKLQKQIEEAQEELNSINVQLEAYQTPIKEQTGGYTTDDLISREVIDTGKTDKNGKPVKQTVYKLIYPDTIVPTTSHANEGNGQYLSGMVGMAGTPDTSCATDAEASNDTLEASINVFHGMTEI